MLPGDGHLKGGGRISLATFSPCNCVDGKGAEKDIIHLVKGEGVKIATITGCTGSNINSEKNPFLKKI